jgi:Domain of unknown function (DUF4268)
MSNYNLSKLTEIDDLRSVWSHEEYDFSNWLTQEENLQILADTIGITIQNPQKEVSVGKFSLDIQAETDDGKVIIIENQLEATNHDHLGKIITYASGVDAEYIIWIVKKARSEHKKAVEWLNNVSNQNINFFLVEIKLFQIGDSQLAPKFEIVCEPNEWAKVLKSSENLETKQSSMIKLDFWQKFIDMSVVYKNRKSTKDNWLAVPTGSSNHHMSLVCIGAKDKKARIEFNLHNSELYKKCLENKDSIEKVLGTEIFFWSPKGERGYFHLTCSYSINDGNKWNEIFDFYLKYSKKLKEIMPKYLV